MGENKMLPIQLKRVLVARIGKENYRKSHLETRKVLIYSELKEFEREVLLGFGSFYNYQKWRVGRAGFKSINEYQTELARMNGYETRWEWAWAKLKKKYKRPIDLYNAIAKKRGDKNHYSYLKKLAKKHGFDSWNEYNNARAKKRGYKSHEDYIAKRNGFKNYYQYRKNKN